MIRGNLLMRYGGNTQENAALVIQNVMIGDLIGNVFPEPLDGLVDTGADRSAVPLRICSALKLEILNRLRVVGFDGRVKECSSYLVYIKIKPFGDVPLEVFGVERTSVLLGRDYLKSMLLIMDKRVQKYGLGASARWKTTWIRLMSLL